MFFALYADRKRTSESDTAVVLAVALMGLSANFATNKLFTGLMQNDLYPLETSGFLQTALWGIRVKVWKDEFRLLFLP